MLTCLSGETMTLTEEQFHFVKAKGGYPRQCVVQYNQSERVASLSSARLEVLSWLCKVCTEVIQLESILTAAVSTAAGSNLAHGCRLTLL